MVNHVTRVGTETRLLIFTFFNYEANREKPNRISGQVPQIETAKRSPAGEKREAVV